ncbi:hypothetical protein Emed_007311 [Eimeria media]
MPAAGESGGGPPGSPQGRGTGGSKGPPGGPLEGPLSWGTASSRSTTEGGAQYSSPARNSTHPASPVGVPRSISESTGALGGGGPLEALMGPPTGLPMGYQPDLHAASSTQPRVLGGSQGRLSMRGPRSSPQGAPLHVTADPDHGEYVHLTDGEYGSGAEDTDAEGGYGGGGGARGPPWGRRRGPPSSLQRFLSGASAYSRLAVRRLSLGCRFLLFWAKDNERQLKVLLYTATLLVSSTGNTIAFKRMLDKMPNYSGFLNQLTNFVFIPVFAAFCIHQYFQGKLSQEVLRFPKRNFALMGCLDGVCGIMSVVGGVHTSGTAQVVLSQLGIPVMLLLCRFVLGKTYNAIQHLGAAVIIVGVLVVESPGLLHPSAEDSSNLPFFNLLFLLSILPSSLSYVVKEVAFRGVQMNTSFLQFWVALFQFFVGFVLLPLTSLPLLGSEVVPLNELWGRLVDGGRCLFGVNSIVPPDCGPAVGLACDACEGAWVEVLVYILFNLIYNVCAMLISCCCLLPSKAVLKHCGATVLFLVMTVRLPLTSMAFYSKLIVATGGGESALGASSVPLRFSAAAAAENSSTSSGRSSSSSRSRLFRGDSAVAAKPTDFFGLVILLVGLLAFRLGAQKPTREDEEVDGDEEGTLERDITATAEAAHVHIKVLASDPNIRNDGYFHYFSDEETPSSTVRRRPR